MSIYRSDCDQYLCRHLGAGDYEAWTRDGQVHWRHDDRVQTWADRARFPYALPWCVGGYSAARCDQPHGSFTLTLLHCDTTTPIVPFTGNTVLEQRRVVFRRKLPYQQLPAWLKQQLAQPQPQTSGGTP